MTAPKFSACVIVRNEETRLPRLLDSLENFRDRGGEVIIVDTGSNDKTIRVARSFQCKVFETGKKFYYKVSVPEAKAINHTLVIPGDLPIIKPGQLLFQEGVARNFAATQAANDFITCVDADEAFTSLDIDTINGAIEAGCRRLEVDFIDQHDVHGNPTNRFWSSWRWYDRRFYHWAGTMHPKLTADNGDDIVRLDPSTCLIEHWQGPSINRSQYLVKLAYSVWAEPEDERQLHAFGRELMVNQRYRSAIRIFARHVLMGRHSCER